MQLIADVLRRYPLGCFGMLLALLAAGVAEGLGIGSLLPMVELATGGGATTAHPLSLTIAGWLRALGLEPGIGVLLALIVGGIALKGLLVLLAQAMVGFGAARFARELRLQLLRALLASRLDHFLHQPLGRLGNALGAEVQAASAAFVNALNALTFLVQALVYAGVACVISARATLAGLLAGALVLGACGALVRVSRRAGRAHSSRLRALSARLADVLAAVRALKAMAQEGLAEAALEEGNARLERAQRRQVLGAAALAAVQEQLFALMIALGMFVALVPLGMPFPTVLVLVLVLGRMLAQLGKTQKEYQKVVAGEGAYLLLRRSIAEGEASREDAPGSRAPTLTHGISLHGIEVAYGEQRVLDGLELEIPAGCITTLTGPSGAGKSTVLDLVLGFLRPQRGEVRVDGVVLGKLDLRAWRRLVGYVPQDTLLLHDTIRNNIGFGDPALGSAAIREALELAGLGEFVRGLPLGLEHVVGERGARLSGGQRQRLMLARALLRRPQLLILDEATSALDDASAAAVCATLRSLRGRLTILAISHREEMMRISDRVIRIGPAGAARAVTGKTAESPVRRPFEPGVKWPRRTAGAG